jgi:hypothetical protein
MAVRRAILGKYNDGTFGLRCSLPGADAAFGSDDQMSFDSNWTDIAKIHQVGIATSSFSKIPFPNLGYKPFMEVRRLDGTTVYDDYISATVSGFNGSNISTDGFVAQAASGTFGLVYLVWRIPAPVQ